MQCRQLSPTGVHPQRYGNSRALTDHLGDTTSIGARRVIGRGALQAACHKSPGTTMPKPNAAASRRGRSNGLKEEAPVGSWVGGRRREALSCGTPSCMPIRSCKREQIQMKIAMQSCINPEIATHVSRLVVGYMASLDLYAVSVSEKRDGDMREAKG